MPSMSVETLRFADPGIARAYIRKLALSFEDPADMLEFLKACDIVQAALAYLLVEENKRQYIERPGFEHSRAEFELVKESLKMLIKKLNGA
jgi:hypothetical protein